jgi:hypothetical protein
VASKTESAVINVAGMVQGIVLVTFPALSTIFTKASEYGLSSTQYGALFLPQVVTAITASLLGAGLAGALGPAFYGALIGNGSSRTGLFVGYMVGAGIMLIGGLVEVFLGVQAAGKSLEQVTKPLTSTDQATPTATVTSIISEPA